MSRASAAVASCLFIPPDKQIHGVSTKNGAIKYDGNPQGFHDWQFRTLVRTAGRKGDEYKKAVSLVVDGLEKDAFTLAVELTVEVLHNEGDTFQKPGIDLLIERMKEMSFPVSAHEAKELFQAFLQPNGIISRQYGESMKQYISRRERCWNMVKELDREITLSENHRADLLLELSGITKDQQLMIGSSIHNSRDLGKTRDALITQHPRIHIEERNRHRPGVPNHLRSQFVRRRRPWGKGKGKKGSKRKGKGKGQYNG